MSRAQRGFEGEGEGGGGGGSVGGEDANPEHQGSILEPLVHAKGDDNGLKGQHAESRLLGTNLRYDKGNKNSLKGQFAESRLSRTSLRHATGDDNGLMDSKTSIQDFSELIFDHWFMPLIVIIVEGTVR